MRLTLEQTNISPITAMATGAAIITLIALAPFIPIGYDWQYNYHPISLMEPYQPGGGFTQPPWVLLMLPHTLLPLEYSNMVNLLLNIAILLLAIRYHGGGLSAYLMVALFPPVWDLARVNNVDWLPLLATMLPPIWGFPILLVKPQTFGAICLIWLKRHGPAFLSLGIVVVLASFAVWGWWPAMMKGHVFWRPWNFAPFPFLIPVGLYLLYKAWLDDDEWLAALSTSLIMPYIGAYSLAGPFAILSAKYPKIAGTALAGTWWYIALWSRGITSL